MAPWLIPAIMAGAELLGGLLGGKKKRKREQAALLAQMPLFVPPSMIWTPLMMPFESVLRQAGSMFGLNLNIPMAPGVEQALMQGRPYAMPIEPLASTLQRQYMERLRALQGATGGGFEGFLADLFGGIPNAILMFLLGKGIAGELGLGGSSYNRWPYRDLTPYINLAGGE